MDRESGEHADALDAATRAGKRAAESRFEAIIDSALDAWAIMHARRDGNGAIVDFAVEYANPALERMHGAGTGAGALSGQSAFAPGAEVLPLDLLGGLSDVVASGIALQRDAVAFVSAGSG